jgi:hypothetical protein
MWADVVLWEGTASTSYTWIWRATAAEASRPAGLRPVPAAVRGRAGLRTPAPGLQALYVQLLRRANSDELSRLFDTVVRLHTASRLSARPPGGGADSRRRDGGHTGSVEQTCRALDLLLRSVGRHHHLAGALGA